MGLCYSLKGCRSKNRAVNEEKQTVKLYSWVLNLFEINPTAANSPCVLEFIPHSLLGKYSVDVNGESVIVLSCFINFLGQSSESDAMLLKH